MFDFCTDPAALEGAQWLSCFLTTGKHMNLYFSVFTVLALLVVTAPSALAFGFAGATAARSPLLPLRWLGKSYISIVRGVPDIAFFLFFVIALDQGFEWLRHQAFCPDWTDPIRQGNDFVVCTAAKLPLSSDPQWMHEVYGFSLAVLTFAIVFGAFAANVLFGASTRAGRPKSWMTWAMVNVLPEPVTPSRTCSLSPSRSPALSCLIASG